MHGDNAYGLWPLVIMIGFLLQWPTLLTLVMFPILAVMYVRLARREEREVQREHGDRYARWATATPAFLPRLRNIFHRVAPVEPGGTA